MKILIPLATGAVEVLLKAGDSLRLARGKDEDVDYLGQKVEQPIMPMTKSHRPNHRIIGRMTDA